MHRKAQSLAIVTGLLLLGAATNAHAAAQTPANQATPASQAAQTAQARAKEFTPSAPASPSTSAPWTLAPAPHRTLQWDAKGRWGFRLDMNEPVNRERGWKDVQAGAFFRVTPSLKVGGTVGVGTRNTAIDPVTPPDAQPRVRLETTFKF